MKKIYSFSFVVLSTFILSTGIHAQDPPEVVWNGFFPVGSVTGNYTANDVKQTPDGSYVMVGSRSMSWEGYGYNEAMFMHLDREGNDITDQRTSTGTTGGVPWDQVLYDMIVTSRPQTFLGTGYRDRTLLSAGSNAGLVLIEMAEDGSILFDSLYYNENLHRVMGRCIRPAIEGGYLIAGSFAEDGGGTEQTFVTRMVKNESGEYEFADSPIMSLIPAGSGGYASWIQQFQEGYLLGGTAYTGPDTKYDIFLQKLDANRNLEWTQYFGMAESDGFADAFVYRDTIYLAGSERVPVSESSYRDQIYVAKLNADGSVIWENTYGGIYPHYAYNLIMSGEGDLLVAGGALDASMHSHMILMKLDAQSGDSIWTQDYGSFYSAGFRDAIRTDDFGYLAVGRANYSGSQDPHVYAMKLDHGGEAEHLQIPRENLGIPILPGTTTTDVINFTSYTDTTETLVDTVVGLHVIIYSLLHPDVSELEVALVHDGKVAVLADRPVHGGENFDTTGFRDFASRPIDWGRAPYTGWWEPEDPLSVFNSSDPAGEWTLRIMDFGSGGTKATDRELVGWSLNFLAVTSGGGGGGGVGIPTEEELANFGLEQIRPNPLDKETSITFRIPKPGPVRIAVYNQLGQLVGTVAEEHLPAGVHSRIWQPGSLTPGSYFIQLQSGNLISVQKVMIAR